MAGHSTQRRSRWRTRRCLARASRIRLRFRSPEAKPIRAVTINGRPWADWDQSWVYLPGDIGEATVRAGYGLDEGGTG